MIRQFKRIKTLKCHIICQLTIKTWQIINQSLIMSNQVRVTPQMNGSALNLYVVHYYDNNNGMRICIPVNKLININRHTTWSISPISMVSQHKLVSSWGLWNGDQCHPMGPHSLGRSLRFTCVGNANHITQWLPPPKKEVMFLVRSVCLSVRRITRNLWTDFDEISCRGRAWLKDQVIQFWWRSGSRFGSGSPKSEIRILWITQKIANGFLIQCNWYIIH